MVQMKQSVQSTQHWSTLLAWLSVILAPVLLGCSSATVANVDQVSQTNGSNIADGSSIRSTSKSASTIRLLNVSYDPTREFYQAFNEAFAVHWNKTTGSTVIIDQSHGGSGKQARAVIDGLQADVVTLALSLDIDAIANRANLLGKDWQSKLPNNSSPYTSTIVFVVRKGNPKKIHDWGDLVQDGVEVITANPKTGGGARWNYLAAWGFVLRRELGGFHLLKESDSEDKVKAAQQAAKAFVQAIYHRVPVLDSAARGSTNTFIQREIGDVLLAWENEAMLSVAEGGADKFEIVNPSLSILAEPPVTVVDKVAEKHGVAEASRAYLEYLYTPIGQSLAAKHYYRPSLPEVVDKDLLKAFPAIELFTIDEAFGGWGKAQADHFADGGIFDQIYLPAK